MNITLNQNDTTNANLKVVLQEADYAPKVDEKIKEYTKKAQIKGFRPGKVPAGLIRKMYGKSILAEEINGLLSKSVNDYIKENNIRILGEPLPDETKQNAIDWDNQKDFEFDFELGILPDFELNPAAGETLDAYKIELDEETINQVHEHLQRQYGETANPETSEANDYLSGELRQLEGEFKTTTLLPINKIKKNQEQFIGVKAGYVITFDLQEVFDNDASAISHVTGVRKAETAELKGNFEFAVEKINRTAAAEFNQELFDKIFGKDAVTTEEEFNNKLRETLAENYQQEADKVLKNKLVEKLVKETEITLPEEFFKKWLAVSNQGKLTPEQIEENFEQYKDELKWSMIRNKIVEENDIKVSNEEVVNATKAKMFAQFNMPEISDELADTMNGYIDNYLKQNNGRNYINEYEAILAEKVLDVLKDKVTVVEKSVTADEFRNLSF
ncbi:trigger factor [Adhaeribacter swui]|uniref:Trigger factor n=1 Tax=Adhaeribacter swui TaxID=2086471 RepID=A0A7G7G2U7_9BACT|nr:trigger factor [Adhaeribacter swui]QNF31481.1 trigger factor [Adhaeribacter swui]